MTREELNYIKDAFSQIIDDIAGNPDWYEAARAIASDLGTLERKLEKKISSLLSNLNEAAEEFYPDFSDSIASKAAVDSMRDAFKAGAEWMAGQRMTVKGLLYGGNLGIPDNIPEEFYIDKQEEVIVQIRKK